MATSGTHADDIVTRLYADHSAALRAYVTRLLRDAHLAEDIVQETMLRAWQHADRLTPEHGNPWPWLRRVAHNIAVDRVRARRTRPTEVDESAARHQAADGDHADRIATADLVSCAVRRLVPKHRDVLYQLYVVDSGAPGAADALGVPVGTLKSRLHDALRRLRQTLDVEPPQRIAA